MRDIATRIITFAFFILFAFTPLFFSAENSELFEFNKMRLVYGLTVVIMTCWVFEMIRQRAFIFRRTPLDLPLLLFFASQVISTIISIDPHTSVWGYYSRSNGGLLSTISYIGLYFAFVSHFQGAQVLKFLKATVLGGLLVSLYAIPEHFGVSPSCIWLTGTWGVDCWVQLVQERVFATLGQPNWLAAYLAMVIFPALYFFLSAERLRQKIFYGVSSLLIYMAFTFTFSRGGTLGLISGVGVFVALYLFTLARNQRGKKFSIFNFQFSTEKAKPIGLILAGILIVNLLFGSALTGGFRLLKQDAPPARPGLVSAGGTQLENGGTESGQIRLIVWKGAIEIFKHFPLFGSGVETFAYSYYQFRPAEHNLNTEWDFLYNKAHNEYLNYLATTGVVGFLCYLLVIVVFLFYCLLKITNYKLQITNKSQIPIPIPFLNSNFKILNSKLEVEQKLLLISLLAGYISYLVQNIFGFSVVMIAVLFFLFPALAFAFVEDLKEPSDEFLAKLSFSNPLIKLIYKREMYTTLALILVLIFGLTFLFKVYENWEADTFYKRGNDFVDSGYVGEGFNTFVTAIELNKSEPLYRSELGFAAAASAVSHNEVDSTEAARIKDIAVEQTELALAKSPKNTSLWRTAIRTYYQLSSIDPQYSDKTIETISNTIKLAPTDPKLYYNKGLILATQDKTDEAIKTLEEAVALKPDYSEAKLLLADLYYQEDQKDKAIQLAEEVLRKHPDNLEASQSLEKFRSK